MSVMAGYLACPIHGQVEGLYLSEGPLSNCVPTVLVCPECDGLGNTVVVGYEGGSGAVVDRWEELPAEDVI